MHCHSGLCMMLPIGDTEREVFVLNCVWDEHPGVRLSHILGPTFPFGVQTGVPATLLLIQHSASTSWSQQKTAQVHASLPPTQRPRVSDLWPWHYPTLGCFGLLVNEPKNGRSLTLFVTLTLKQILFLFFTSKTKCVEQETN